MDKFAYLINTKKVEHQKYKKYDKCCLKYI